MHVYFIEVCSKINEMKLTWAKCWPSLAIPWNINYSRLDLAKQTLLFGASISSGSRTSHSLKGHYRSKRGAGITFKLSLLHNYIVVIRCIGTICLGLELVYMFIDFEYILADICIMQIGKHRNLYCTSTS